jgi:hypothetical protein
MSYTPGPWKVLTRERAKGIGLRGTKHHSYIGNESWEGLLRVVTRMKGDSADCKQGLANLRLVSAVPELLEALKALCDVPDVAGWPETHAALAVIAKATHNGDED